MITFEHNVYIACPLAQLLAHCLLSTDTGGLLLALTLLPVAVTVVERWLVCPSCMLNRLVGTTCSVVIAIAVTTTTATTLLTEVKEHRWPYSGK